MSTEQNAEKNVGGSDLADFAARAGEWVGENPREAVLLGAIGGFAVGLVGFRRMSRGIESLRSLPMVSQLLLGAVTKGVLSGTRRRTNESTIH